LILIQELALEQLELDFSFTVNSPSTGFVKGAATVGINTGNIICSSTLNVAGSGKKFIFCVGEDPDDNNELFNILLISK
jgi:hypothetical protein